MSNIKTGQKEDSFLNDDEERVKDFKEIRHLNFANAYRHKLKYYKNNFVNIFPEHNLDKVDCLMGLEKK